MIKARPVAGDLALGAAFLEAIRPFVWRRGLDFAAVADIHAMKRRIDQHKGGALADAARPGGAHRRPQREAGRGRHPRDRVPGADPAARLGRPRSRAARPDHAGRAAAAGARRARAARCRARAGVPPIASCAASSTGCRWSPTARCTSCRSGRRSWPASPRSWAIADAAAFAAELLRHLRPGARALRRGVRAGAGAAGRRPRRRWNWISAASMRRREATVAALRALGFGNPERIVAAVRGWQAGHVRALRSARARELLAQMLPRMLAALARQPQPDTVFNRFDAFLARQPAGVQLLSLFQRNPGLLDRIAAVLGAAPSLADHLASHPAALDGLLQPGGESGSRPSAARPAAGRAAAGGRHRDHPPHRARGGFHRLGRHDGGPDRRRRGRAAPHRDRRCRARRAAAAGAGGFRRRASAGCAAGRWRWWRWARRAGGR